MRTIGVKIETKAPKTETTRRKARTIGLKNGTTPPLERDTDGQKRDAPKKGAPENSKIRGGRFPLLRVMATKIAKINGV